MAKGLKILIICTLIAVACVACVAFVNEFLSAPTTHDEFEHCHVAWLMAHGKQPFTDFFEHHSVALWHLLRTFYWFYPDAGPEVMYWGRIMCAAAALTSLWLIFKIGKALMSKWIGVLWVLIWLPSNFWRVIKFEECRSAGLRPETFAIPFILGSLYCIISQRDDQDKIKQNHQWLMAALWASLAVMITPRASAYWLGVVILVAFRTWKGYAMPRLALWATLVIGPLLFIATTGPHHAYQWVTVFSSKMMPAFGPKRGFEQYPGEWVMFSAGLTSLILLFGGSGGKFRFVALLMQLQFLELLAEQRPAQYAFTLTYLFATGLFVYLCHSFWTAKSVWIKSLGLIIFIGVLCRIGERVHFWCLDADQGKCLISEVKRRRAWCNALQGETVLMDPSIHPIGLADASYLWFDLHLFSAGSLHAAGIELKGMDIVQDLERNKPALITFRFAFDMLALGGFSSEYCQYMSENYRMLRWAFVRKDLVDQLEDDAMPVQLTPEEMKSTMLGFQRFLELQHWIYDLPKENRVDL